MGRVFGGPLSAAQANEIAEDSLGKDVAIAMTSSPIATLTGFLTSAVTTPEMAMQLSEEDMASIATTAASLLSDLNGKTLEHNLAVVQTVVNMIANTRATAAMEALEDAATFGGKTADQDSPSMGFVSDASPKANIAGFSIAAVVAIATASGVSLAAAVAALSQGQGVSAYSGALAATFGQNGPIGTTLGNIYAGRGGGSDSDAPTGAGVGAGQGGIGSTGAPEAP